MMIGLAPHETVAFIAATLLKNGVRTPHALTEEKIHAAIQSARRLIEVAQLAEDGGIAGDEEMPIL